MSLLGNPIFVLLFLGFTSFLLALILTPVFRNLALRFEFVDEPDNHRKLHSRPIPRVGGVAIVLAYLGSFLFLVVLGRARVFTVPGASLLALQLLPSAAVVFATGLVDDLVGLKPWQKLVGQFFGACLACAAGVRIAGVAGHAAQDWWSVPLTVIWLLGCTNAINLIDGIDGLAAGVGLFATCTTLLAAILQGNLGLAIATVPLVGCLLGFLRYNFSPASIFLGDSGSLSIGFLLGLYAALWSQKSATLVGMLAPAMALALPLLDVVLSVMRRFLGNKPIFSADRGHIHHRLLARGLAPKAAALVLYGACGIAAALSLLQGMLYHQLGGLVVVLFCAIVGVAVRQLGYVEFQVAHQVFRRGIVRRVVQEEIGLRHFQELLRRASTLDEYWPAVRDTCLTFGFHSIELKLHDETFVMDDRPPGASRHWLLQADLPGFGHVKLWRRSGASSSLLVMRIFDMLQHRLEQFERARPHLEISYGRSAALPSACYLELSEEEESVKI